MVIVVAETETCQIDAGFALARNEILKHLGVGDADIEIAVGRQQHAIDRALDEAGFRQLIGDTDALAACRRTAGLQVLDRGHDLRLFRSRRWVEHDSDLARIGNDGDAIVGFELVDQKMERALEQRQFVGLVHRARGVDQKNEIGARPLRFRQIVTFDADMEDLGVLVPWRRIDAHAGLERNFAAGRARIGVIEVIDHLLDADRIGLRQHAIIQRVAHDAV